MDDMQERLADCSSENATLARAKRALEQDVVRLELQIENIKAQCDPSTLRMAINMLDTYTRDYVDAEYGHKPTEAERKEFLDSVNIDRRRFNLPPITRG